MVQIQFVIVELKNIWHFIRFPVILLAFDVQIRGCDNYPQKLIDYLIYLTLNY